MFILLSLFYFYSLVIWPCKNRSFANHLQLIFPKSGSFIVSILQSTKSSAERMIFESRYCFLTWQIASSAESASTLNCFDRVSIISIRYSINQKNYSHQTVQYEFPSLSSLILIYSSSDLFSFDAIILPPLFETYWCFIKWVKRKTCNMSLFPWLRLYNSGDKQGKLFIFVYNMQHV